jgi:hypothetical protein
MRAVEDEDAWGTRAMHGCAMHCVLRMDGRQPTLCAMPAHRAPHNALLNPYNASFTEADAHGACCARMRANQLTAACAHVPWILQGGGAEWSVPELSRTAAAGLQALRMCALNDSRPKLSIEAVRGCAQLRNLSLRGCQVVDLTPLQGCSELQILNISRGYELKSLEGLQACGKLERLDLSDCSSVSSIEPLSACLRLKTVNMYACTSVTSVAPLLACAELEWLDVAGCPLPRSELEALQAALPRLVIRGADY